MQLFNQRLSSLLKAGAEYTLRGGLIGIEKESLRIGETGLIAQTSHPHALGLALTHPYITTDYSEALLEFVTPPRSDGAEALEFLQRIHRFVYSQLDDELLWAASMPCVVDGDASIRIAEYGRSNQGQLKHIYRRGLGYRYGRVMQVIAGIHFNFSMAEEFWPVWQALEHNSDQPQHFITEAYFGLIRNVQRYGWLLYYLFGASPALCKSFLKNKASSLQEYNSNTLYLPYATSLRMSDIGYTNRKRCALKVSTNSLQDYCQGLYQALHSQCWPYALIGVKVGDEYRQLSPNILQIENEYYSLIRPKQPPRAGERPLLALRERGVAYVELRSNDINLFDPVGLNASQMRFLEAFLIFSLLQDSPPIDEAEQAVLEHNQLLSARQGRQPGLRLQSLDGGERSLQEWGLELCQAVAAICDILDQGREQPLYRTAIEQQIAALHESDYTPSARALAEMREHQEGFFHFARRWSEQHRDTFLAEAMSEMEMDYWRELAQNSLAQQQALENTDSLSFDDYLQTYLAAV